MRDIEGFNLLRLRQGNKRPAPIELVGAARLAKWLFNLTVWRHWRGRGNIPADGPAIIVVNHISNADPVAICEFLIYAGRWPHILARDNLLDPRHWWGRLFRRWGMIPVERGSIRAKDSLIAAKKALLDGQIVVIYPESTFTQDPLGWPMTGHTGAVRLAMETGVPLIPIGQWGPQQFMPGLNATYPRIFPRKTFQITARPPIDLTDLIAMEDRGEAVRRGIDRVMDVLTEIVAELRHEEPPPGRYDRKTGLRVASRDKD